MMSGDIATAEAGGQQSESWWLTKWSSWLATIGALALGFMGGLGIFSNIVTFSLWSAIAAGFQVCAAAIILSIEGSSVVSFLKFAKPIGLIFEGKPLYVKVAVYAMLTVFPMLFNPSSIPVMLGFLISAAITALYGMILIGKKGNLDDMRAAAEQPKI